MFPIHPRTRARLAEDGGLARLEDAGVACIEPVGYLDFLSLQAGAGAIVTDSGGVQEEASALGVSCFTFRPNTERPVTLTHGTNVLLGEDPAEIAEVRPAPHPPTPCAIPLWDGHAGRARRRRAGRQLRADAGRRARMSTRARARQGARLPDRCRSTWRRPSPAARRSSPSARTRSTWRSTSPSSSRCRDDELLRSAVENSAIVNADGQGVVLAARLLGTRLPERVAGIDLMDALMARAAERG